MAPEFLKSAYRRVRRLRNRRFLERATPSVSAFLVSYPKSGRTWLRYLLSCYFAKVAGLGFEPDLRSTFRILPNFDRDAERGLPAFLGRELNVVLPLIAVSHRQFDAPLFSKRPTIILVRDPRDVCVSAYFHETKHKQRFSDTIGEFIEDQEYGVPAIVRYHNGWAKGLAESRSLVVSYEEMSSSTDAVVRRILNFAGVPIDETALGEAIEKARFSKMQKTEKETGIPGHNYDRGDGDSLRVRKGKVGGYADTLSDSDAFRVLEICRNSMIPEAKLLLRQSGVVLD
ncbi:sulfotransferase domain-containing protein [Sphingopyxis sp.]|uniref:sulfotransferase domain-containing protein n=1 Tax=Sphingopyxis sp. TaxID=1908224 RepID=UPI003D0C5E08